MEGRREKPCIQLLGRDMVLKCRNKQQQEDKAEERKKGRNENKGVEIEFE